MHENYVYRKFWKRQKYRLQNSRFRKAGSAVSVILECEAREPHTGAASLTILPRRFFHTLQSFVRIWSVACVRKKIRLFCSLLKIVYSALTWSRVCKKWVQNKHLRDNRIIDHYKITEPLLALSLVTRLWRFRFARTFENYFIKVIEHFFHVYKTSSKHSGTGRILESYANPRRSRGLQNCLELSQPSSCLGEAVYVKTEKVLYCLISERGWSLLEKINTDFPCSLMHSLGGEYYVHTRLQVSAE